LGFFAPAKCLWFREFEAQITSNSCHELKHATLFEWRCDLKMNFSGMTGYLPHELMNSGGLVKNTAQLITLFALSNLWMVRKRIIQGPAG
jgi:hypothetical protein